MMHTICMTWSQPRASQWMAIAVHVLLDLFLATHSVTQHLLCISSLHCQSQVLSCTLLPHLETQN